MLVLLDFPSCTFVQSLEAELKLGHLLASEHLAVLALLICPDFLYFEALLEQVDGAFGAVEHFFLSLSQFRDESILGLHRGDSTFLFA